MNADVGFVASIVTLVVAALAVLSAVRHRFLVVLPARRFWQLDPREDVRFVLSIPILDLDEHTVYIPAGDSLAFGEIGAFLKRQFPRIELTFHRSAERPIEDWDRNVVLVGGGKSNLTTRFLLAALNPPLYGRDHEHPKHDRKELISRHSGKPVLAAVVESNRLSTDYGYIIRAPNPFHPKRVVFVFVGAFAHGTHAAALWSTQSGSLSWLWRDNLRRGLAELLRIRPRTDSVEVILTARAQGQFSKAEVAAIGELKVWHETSERRPYRFRTPPGYGDAYNRMVSEHATQLAASGLPIATVEWSSDSPE